MAVPTLVVEDVRQSATTCTPDDVVDLSVVAWDSQDGDLTYSWSQPTELTTAGFVALSDTTGPEVTFFCPPCPPGRDGALYEVLVRVQNAANVSAYGSAEITMSCDAAAGDTGAGEPAQVGGCTCAVAAGTLSGSMWIVLFGALALACRRRNPAPARPDSGQAPARCH